MTNNDLLAAVQAWLEADDLLDGYTVRHGTYSLNDVTNNLPLALFRVSGSGVINSNIMEKSVRIAMVTNQTGWPAAREALDAIAVKARDKTVDGPAGTIKVRLLSNTNGPLSIEDENKMLYLDLMVTI